MGSSRQIATVLILVATAMFSLRTARPQSAKGDDKKPTNSQNRGSLLLRQDLPPMDGNHLKLAVLEMKCMPDCTTPPHFHSGPVFVYVLEGAITSQVKGQQQPEKYEQGQWLYEPPEQPHLVSKNASLTEPARALVFFLTDNDKPFTTILKLER